MRLCCCGISSQSKEVLLGVLGEECLDLEFACININNNNSKAARIANHVLSTLVRDSATITQQPRQHKQILH